MNRLPWLIVGAAGIGLVLFLLYNLQSEAQTPSPAATTPVRPAGPQDAPTSLGGPSAVERPVRESPPPAPAPAPDKPPQAAPAPTAPAVAGAPGGTLRGKVMAPSGQPMAGAAVVARRQDTQLFGFQSYGDPLGTGQTDATGEFVLASVPPGRDVHLFVTTKEHAPAKFTGLVVKEGEETQVPTIFLKDGGSISGAVSGDPGASKAEVVVAPFSLFSMGNDVEELRTKTDERGRYRVARVPAGKVRVTVRGEGLAQQSRYEVEVQDGQETTGIDFQVTTGKSVVGTVRCDSGPLEGVRVLASPVDFTSNAPGEAKTGPDGRFEIRHLSGEEYNVVASKKGYQTPSRISVFPGGNEIEIRLEPNCSIKGRVVDETTGQPVRGFSVRWGRSRNGRILGTGQRKDFETAKGEFTLEDLEPGKYVLEGSSPEHAITESPEVDVIRGVPATEVVLALNHGGSLAGRVQSAVDGKPVAGAAVVIMNSKFGAVSPMIILGNVDVSDRRTTTDAQGRFRVPNLRGGTFWLRIEHDSFAPRRVDEVTVDRGRETPLEDILLFVGGRIRGVVLRTDGKPDAEAEIQVTSPNPDRPFDRRVATDHRGAFELDHIPPGEYLVLPIKKAGKFDVMGLINATGTKILVEEGRVREVSF